MDPKPLFDYIKSLALLGILILCAAMVGVGFLLGWFFTR